jgi:hypothetical protein
MLIPDDDFKPTELRSRQGEQMQDGRMQGELNKSKSHSATSSRQNYKYIRVI